MENPPFVHVLNRLADLDKKFPSPLHGKEFQYLGIVTIDLTAEVVEIPTGDILHHLNEVIRLDLDGVIDRNHIAFLKVRRDRGLPLGALSHLLNDLDDFILIQFWLLSWSQYRPQAFDGHRPLQLLVKGLP